MWWGIGIGGGLLYLILVFTLGLMTLRNRHGWMFFFRDLLPGALDLWRLHETAGEDTGRLGQSATGVSLAALRPGATAERH
jgi:hypothetical protein